jgi:hypothetical protein
MRCCLAAVVPGRDLASICCLILRRFSCEGMARVTTPGCRGINGFGLELTRHNLEPTGHFRWSPRHTVTCTVTHSLAF